MELVEGEDHVYSAVIPSQEDKVVVEFYVQASDLSKTRKWPAPTTAASLFSEGLQEANALYQVDDRKLSGIVYHLIMTTPDRRQFDQAPRSSDALFNATLVVASHGKSRARHR